MKDLTSDLSTTPPRGRRTVVTLARMGIVVLAAGMATVAGLLPGGSFAAGHPKLKGEVRTATATFPVGPNMRVSVGGGGAGGRSNRPGEGFKW